ncbi:hypothetical protein NDU88_006176 [Pleurodeles waltl]|uniref:Uncharacterized protein n=1 Tax=Pleurodeles waltl TaxID=8319 RepID=A0AAV7MZN3_PLEWA|nr:hypothetical protein NDU88_006176 [Pleurodeles waltl]
MELRGRQEKEELRGRQEKEEFEGQRRVEAEKQQMRLKPWGPMEKTLRRKMALRRPLPRTGGEDTQRRDHVREKRGPCRYELQPQRDTGRWGFEILKGGGGRMAGKREAQMNK